MTWFVFATSMMEKNIQLKRNVWWEPQWLQSIWKTVEKQKRNMSESHKLSGNISPSKQSQPILNVIAVYLFIFIFELYFHDN